MLARSGELDARGIRCADVRRVLAELVRGRCGAHRLRSERARVRRALALLQQSPAYEMAEAIVRWRCGRDAGAWFGGVGALRCFGLWNEGCAGQARLQGRDEPGRVARFAAATGSAHFSARAPTKKER